MARSSEPVMNLVVIRSVDLERSRRFYTALGLRLSREQHGFGPEHLVATVGAIVLEIYPQNGGAKTAGVRLGFVVESVATTIATLQAVGGTVIAPIRESEWGARAVVADLDGHRLELVERRIAPHE